MSDIQKKNEYRTTLLWTMNIRKETNSDFFEFPLLVLQILYWFHFLIDLFLSLSDFNIFLVWYLDAAGRQPIDKTSENGWMESILLSFLPTWCRRRQFCHCRSCPELLPSIHCQGRTLSIFNLCNFDIDKEFTHLILIRAKREERGWALG